MDEPDAKEWVVRCRVGGDAESRAQCAGPGGGRRRNEARFRGIGRVNGSRRKSQRISEEVISSSGTDDIAYRVGGESLSIG